MKKILLLFWAVISLAATAQAQSVSTSSTDSVHKSGFYGSIRGGYDLIPMYDNNTPYIDYKGGFMAGASANYYWNWLGIGADFDFIHNTPKDTYPNSNLFTAGGTPITGLLYTSTRITRMFYGIGPSFKYQRNNRWVGELFLRGGLSSVKGNVTSLTSKSPALLLNYHAGYNAKNIFAAKAQAQASYYFNPWFGVQAGAYYLRHFNAPELRGTGGVSAQYHPFTPNDGIDGGYTLNETPAQRQEPCNCPISSIGLFGGVVFKLNQGKKIAECPVCHKKHTPQCCQTCGCNVTITARDKFTKELLANTDVVLTNETGAVVQSGTTNSYGTVVFNEVIPGIYMIKGKLHDVALQNGAITMAEFERCQEKGGIQKEILYADENFILKGNAVVCNTPKPIPGVTVILKDKANAIEKNTRTDDKGEFIFHLKQRSTATIHGKKDKFFSQIVDISTADYDRNKTLFIKLEMCMEETDCGKAIRLQNIHYDLDKYFIREDAKPDLNRLVQFMNDNPDVRVKLSSHTDARASDSYNMTLSQNRADAAVNYLVSQGIAKSRLTGIGYGERRLLNKCADGVDCSEADHQLNRRTEMEVICPDEK